MPSSCRLHLPAPGGHMQERAAEVHATLDGLEQQAQHVLMPLATPIPIKPGVHFSRRWIFWHESRLEPSILSSSCYEAMYVQTLEEHKRA